MIPLSYRYPNGEIFEGLVDVFPDTCPFCEKGVVLVRGDAYSNGYERDLQVIFQCPRNECKKFAVGMYRFSEIVYVGQPEDPEEKSLFALHEVLPKTPVKSRNFESEIARVSPAFVEIYNQAYAAEQLGLDQIDGVGYRKALEFLIKDFASSERPSEAEQIRKTMLGKCIENFIDDPRIQDCARRATWLGNDETHYIRKWTDRDVRDLKILIDLVIFWLSSVLLTRKYKAEMRE